ncbi:MAG TPA: hypothetical protein VH268_14520, partial [Solirubrobacterales bacterium]|nr:hypothetical protein [Solirubrobacterales bacterium]
SVLADDNWTAGVGPIGPGSSSLPAKTAKWTTTQGKLTQDEGNAAAKAFRSAKFDLRYYDDDVWAKNNPDAEPTTTLAA